MATAEQQLPSPREGEDGASTQELRYAVSCLLCSHLLARRSSSLDARWVLIPCSNAVREQLAALYASRVVERADGKSAVETAAEVQAALV